jgi:hypothetical protein
MFEVYTREVEINGNKYLLKPLPGKYLSKLYHLATVFEAASKEDNFMAALDEKSTQYMFELCYESMKSSYPGTDAAVIESFVSQNLMKIIPVVVEVNLNHAQS